MSRAPVGAGGLGRQDGMIDRFADWKCLPFIDNLLAFGFWDPPYDTLYKQEGKKSGAFADALRYYTHVYPSLG